MNIVDKLITEGWYLTIADDTTKPKNTTQYYILPPDNRKKWAATWTRVPYGSLVILLPHYYNQLAGVGMPSRLGKRTMY